jgi:hypothetical protein
MQVYIKTKWQSIWKQETTPTSKEHSANNSQKEGDIMTSKDAMERLLLTLLQSP